MRLGNSSDKTRFHSHTKSRCLLKNISIFCNIVLMKILIATIFWYWRWRYFFDDDDSAKTRSELRGVSYRRFFSCPPIGRWPASTLICKKLNLKSFWKYHETWHSPAFKERQWQTYGLQFYQNCTNIESIFIGHWLIESCPFFFFSSSAEKTGFNVFFTKIFVENL